MCVGITAALPTLPATPRGTERLGTCPRSRSSEGGWARAASLRALSETSQDVREPGKPGAWSGRLGDAAPEKSSGLRQERWRQALGAGLTLRLPGCWASRAWSPGFLSTCCSPAQRSSLLLPQASLSCLHWRKTAPSTLLASDPRHPTHPWLAQHLLLSWLHAHLGIVPGAPLWTASVQRPRHQELEA